MFKIIKKLLNTMLIGVVIIYFTGMAVVYLLSLRKARSALNVHNPYSVFDIKDNIDMIIWPLAVYRNLSEDSHQSHWWQPNFDKKTCQPISYKAVQALKATKKFKEEIKGEYLVVMDNELFYPLIRSKELCFEFVKNFEASKSN